jgi:xanthine dehydrogenase accessory factor
VESKHDRDKLIIVGSGNVALNVYKIASLLDYEICIIDNRPETLTWDRFPEASELLLGDIVELLKNCEITNTTSIVLLSHNHEFDEPALRAIVKSPARYIGVIGNKRKVTSYFNTLRSMGIEDELMARIHLPIGLDLGGQLAAEIALSAVAEIQAVKYGRSGGPVIIKQSSTEKEKHDQLF